MDSDKTAPVSNPHFQILAEHRNATGEFTAPEKLVGAAAAFEHPLVTDAVASAMLERETDPARRYPLTSMRDASRMWWVLGGALGIVVLIALLSLTGRSGGASDSCQGGRAAVDLVGPDYRSDDGKHWTVTYECAYGGSTTIPIDRKDVPYINDESPLAPSDGPP